MNRQDIDIRFGSSKAYIKHAPIVLNAASSTADTESDSDSEELISILSTASPMPSVSRVSQDAVFDRTLYKSAVLHLISVYDETELESESDKSNESESEDSDTDKIIRHITDQIRPLWYQMKSGDYVENVLTSSVYRVVRSDSSDLSIVLRNNLTLKALRIPDDLPDQADWRALYINNSHAKSYGWSSMF